MKVNRLGRDDLEIRLCSGGRMESLSRIWPAIEAAATRLGCLRAGASPFADTHAGLFENWLAQGYGASMTYLANNAAVRAEPLRRFPWGRSVIVVTIPYEPERSSPPGSIAAHTARYALGDDYHDVIGGMLMEIETVIAQEAPGSRTWRYVDTGPFSDRSFAAQAGLGWIGRNGMLIDPEHGSWIFIGTLITSLEHDLEGVEEVADRCGSCTRCVEACPTDAILPGRLIDSNRCISHATIELRGEIPAPIAQSLGGNLFGCDICQEVCPWNEAPAEPHPAFRVREDYRARPVTDLLGMKQEAFSSLFRKSAIKRAKLAGMVRNA
ncbi:MAG TPA: tRNA epoxyqueuosine(34) reductase QueG, partial [Thermoanaerobaculia bacterium]|nr:tRNA epoxyqueuosine(34) reductase QueG [Thermoanaerobaculia bacterium]